MPKLRHEKLRKGTIHQHHKMVVLIEIVGIVSVMATGLSSWIVSSDAVSPNSFIGVFFADVQATITQIDCIDNLTVNSFQYAAGYGFVDVPNHTYINTCTISGSADFNVAHAKTVIASLVNDSRCSIVIRFSTSLGASFSASNPTLSGGFSSAPSSVAVGVGSYTSAMGFNVTLSAAELEMTVITGLSFSVTLTYSGDLSSFPDLKNETFSFTLIPGDYLV